tara:strand:+ start:1249 stop:1527 length:279 start_codon:yes stop_codon:yes gene_type:complete
MTVMTKEEQRARDARLYRDELEFQQSLGELNGIEAYAKATDQQKGIIAFGMTPVELFPETCEYGGVADHHAWKKGFALGLMTAAKNAKAMVV